MADLYRKRAIDRLSSPEQLDRMIPIARPYRWLLLVAGILAAAGLIAWFSMGSVI